VTAFGGRVLTDDLRFCAALTGAALDPVGVYALLLFGQAPPPFTCFRGVQRLVGGYRYRIDAKGMAATREFIADPAPTTDVAVGQARVGDILDELVSAFPKHALLFFSGGVDSALLAARAVALGRTDIRLLNYAFGPHDPEAAHALRVAAYLRLACERVTHDAHDMTHVLDRLARDYAFPFGDLSTLPTNLLVHAALGNGSQPDAVIEGTGADGAFGLSATYTRWRTVFAMPAPLRMAGSVAYDWLRLWRFDFSLERVLRFVRKSTHLGLGPAVLAQHALDGIAFDVPGGAAVREPDAQTLSPEERLSQLDLAWVCAGRMAPKTFDPLRARGVHPIYPYLEPDLLQASSSVAWSVKSAGGEEKALLKTLLARQLPASLVYRRKSGFTPPYRTTLASPPLQAFLHDVVLTPANPILEWCDVPTVRDLVTRAGRGAQLSAGAVDFLWTLAFTSGWLRQLPPAVAIEQRSVA
jgi:asparagine synthetase B (glutamine-hydrolysing)